MIQKILIANRGEITCRIIRTCQKMGIHTVAVYSDADSNALHVTMADEGVALGGNSASESYLDMEKVINAATRTNADAIHPGYGFLAENATFAQKVIDAGIIWIGPSPSAIEAMGKKREAKLMLKDVPLVPGYSGDDQTDEIFIAEAEKIGYPVMIKASAGGGGKGMRRVDDATDISEALATARREAQQAFGDDTLILEKLIENPRHIEIQIFGDKYGNVVTLGERECSIQRRHQKIIEEAPSPFVDDALRREMCEVAVNIGKQLGYTSAGTVEFLVDDDKNFYFMEMNTRLQVEHPVTEAVYDVDLVRLQINTADPDFLPNIPEFLGGNDIIAPKPKRHAIEVRVYAEDPYNDFLPVTGHILRWQCDANDHIRVDSGIRSHDDISIHYDPMIAKIIAVGNNRKEAIRRLDYALSQTKLLGLRHNIPFLRDIITHADFINGDTTTAFIEQHPELLVNDQQPPIIALIAAAIMQQRASAQSTNGLTQWRNNPNRPIRQTFVSGDVSYQVLLHPAKSNHLKVTINENEHDLIVSLENTGLLPDGDITLTVDGHRQKVTITHLDDAWWVHTNSGVFRLKWVTPLPLPGRTTANEGSLRAPMTGQVISLRVTSGQQVDKGAILMTLEAMKMEHRILAPYDGVVGDIFYGEGEPVQAEAILLEVQQLNGDPEQNS